MGAGKGRVRVWAPTSVGMKDQWHVRVHGAHGRDHALRVRQAELGKLVRRQVVRPRVEQLHHLRSRGASASRARRTAEPSCASGCCQDISLYSRSAPAWQELMLPRQADSRLCVSFRHYILPSHIAFHAWPPVAPFRPPLHHSYLLKRTLACASTLTARNGLSSCWR